MLTKIDQNLQLAVIFDDLKLEGKLHQTISIYKKCKHLSQTLGMSDQPLLPAAVKSNPSLKNIDRIFQKL